MLQLSYLQAEHSRIIMGLDYKFQLSALLMGFFFFFLKIICSITFSFKETLYTWLVLVQKSYENEQLLAALAVSSITGLC